MQTGSSDNGNRFDAAQAIDRGRTVGKELINRQIDQRSTLLGQQISQAAQTIRDVASDFEKRGQGKYVREIADAVAKYVASIGSYLEGSDPIRLGHDFETLARRQPVLVGAIALVGGFVASRILRVSTTANPNDLGSDSPSASTTFP